MRTYADFAPDCDVKVTANPAGGFTCSACDLAIPDRGCGREDTVLASISDMLVHLEQHVVAGHQVPAATIGELKSDH